MKKILSKVLAMSLILTSLVGCSDDSSNASNNATNDDTNQTITNSDVEVLDFKVGVIQYVEHSALDLAREGFVNTLVEAGIPEANIDIQNAQGEQMNCATIATKFVNDKVDLILAIATPAAQAAAQATGDIPILATAVTDYEVAGLVSSNISGTSDMNPIQEQIDLLMEIAPDAQNIGVMYCSSEDNSILQANIAIEIIESLGLSAQTFTAADTNEVQQVAQNAVGKVDAIYIPTDNLFASTMATVSQIASPAQIPVICGEGGMVESGGLASYGIDYEKLGAQTATQALSILVDGTDISEIPVEFSPVSDLQSYVNEDLFAEFGLEIPESLK